MKIGLLSDTHSHLDESVFSFFADCDEIWHAGDFGNPLVADRLEAFKPLRGVWGNIDEPSLRRRFPEHQVFSCEGLKVWMTHIGGYPGKYPKKIVQGLLEHSPGLFICGHSHILKVIPDPQYQLLHINPGAFGLEGWHKSKTCLRFEVAQGRVQGLELLEKPKHLGA